jgi:hypothetical protein
VAGGIGYNSRDRTRNPMKLNRRFRLPPRFLLVAFLLISGAASAQQKIDLKTHPFFKQLIGEWTAEGERKSADGSVTKVTQESKIELYGDNAVLTEGKRERNGQVTNFKWMFVSTDAGTIEATYHRDASNPDGQRFEVQAAEDGSRLEMTALGDNNAKTVTVEAFKDGDHDTIETTTTRTDANGAVVYSSVMVGKRKKG